MRNILIFAILAMLLAACGIVTPGQIVGPGSMMHPGSSWRSIDRYESNGERIYFTATNDRGERIPYRGGQNSGGMMGGASLACASCHGPDARGGVHTMHMDVMDAPDIRYSALSGEVDEHGDENHAGEHDEYDLDAFRQAVVEGVHPDGDDLSREMPRWQIDDGDLADLLEYLKSLPQ